MTASHSPAGSATSTPSYLSGQDADWAQNPRAAQLAWFKRARYGLFLHYGVYSQLGRGEWVQFRENIPVAVYERLIDGFTAERFDANAICDLALAAGMHYVNLTTRHQFLLPMGYRHHLVQQHAGSRHT